MFRKLFVVALLIAMMLSACGGQARSQTALPTSAETPLATAPAATEKSVTLPSGATSTETSAALPIETSTVDRTSIPTNSPDCTNSATFVADVTIPDNSNVSEGSSFTKTWRINNTGTCTWGPDYTLTHYSDEQMGAPASVPLGFAMPGQSLDISVDLTASNSIGIHRGNFVIKNPDGLIMQVDNDSRLWVIINVTNTISATETSGTTNSSVTSTNTASTGSGSGLANVTCSFATDPAKLTETINAVNAYRAQNGLPAYTVNAQLTQAAQEHANDMACNKLFVHTGSDKSTPQTRVTASGYAASSMSENVYGSYPPLSGQGAVSWWMNDKTDLRHNQNLLSNIYIEIGVGYSFFDNFGFYVIVFAAPKSSVR